MDPVNEMNEELNVTSDQDMPEGLSEEMDKILQGVGGGKKKVDEAYLPPKDDDEDGENGEEEPLPEGDEEGKDNDDDNEDDGQEEEPSPEAEADDGEIIPERLVNAARQAQLEDAVITKLYKEAPQVLERIANYRDLLDAQVSGPTVKPEVRPDESEAERPELIEQIKVSDRVTDDMSDTERERVERDVKIQNQIIDRINKQTLANHEASVRLKQQQQLEEENYTRTVDSVFDADEKFKSVFGKSNSLTQAQIQVRKTVHEIAVSLNRANPTDSIKDSLKKAMKAYTGLYVDGDKLKKDAKKEVINELNKNKRRFLARPRGQKVVKTPRDQKSIEAQEIADMTKTAADLGIDLR